MANQQDPRTTVRSTTRLWSEDVARALAQDGQPTADPKRPIYEFSGDHTFYEPPGTDPYRRP